MRKILGVFEVFLGVFEKTKEKKDREGNNFEYDGIQGSWTSAMDPAKPLSELHSEKLEKAGPKGPCDTKNTTDSKSLRR